MADSQTPIITVAELQQRLASGEKFFLLDVRTRGEFEAGRLPFSDALIPYDILGNNLELLPTDKNLPIYCFCRSGRRSGITTDLLRKQGYTKAFNVEGGIIAWKNAGLEIVTGPSPNDIPVL